MMLDSFISTQKVPAQKALRKKFREYTRHTRDPVDLLVLELQALMREQLRAHQMGAPAPDGMLTVTFQ